MPFHPSSTSPMSPFPGLGYSLPLLHAGVTAWLLSPGHLCLFSVTSELQDVDMC